MKNLPARCFQRLYIVDQKRISFNMFPGQSATFSEKFGGLYLSTPLLKIHEYTTIHLSPNNSLNKEQSANCLHQKSEDRFKFSNLSNQFVRTSLSSKFFEYCYIPLAFHFVPEIVLISDSLLFWHTLLFLFCMFHANLSSRYKVSFCQKLTLQLFVRQHSFVQLVPVDKSPGMFLFNWI